MGEGPDQAIGETAAAGGSAAVCAGCGQDLAGVGGPCPACGAVRPAEGPEETFGSIFRKLGPAGWVGVFAAVMPALGGFALLGSLGIVGPWLQSQEFAGVALYVTAFVVAAGLALLPTYAQAILGGWAFGFWTGLPAALLGFFGASLIGYEIGRRASGDRVMRLLDQHPQWRAVRDALVGGEEGAGFFRTLGIVTLVRIPPNSPFAVTNIVLSSVRVGRLPYALGTLIGMAPRTAVAVFLASEVQSSVFDKDAIAKPWWYWVGAIGASALVIVVLYVVGKRAVARVGRAGAADATGG